MIRNNWAGLIVVGTALAGCGGGGGGGSAPPATPPAPTMAVQGSIARTIASGTGVHLEVTAQASNFTPSGTLYASAGDGASLVQGPVTVTVNGGGSYTFALDTLASKPGGRYTGNLTIKLCSDQACTAAQAIPSITVPFDITVQTSDSAWPGDKLTALSAVSGLSDWATFQGNNAHTGYVPMTVDPDRITLRWKRGALNDSNAGYSAVISPLVTANGRFFASTRTQLSAYQENDGAVVWSYDTGNTIESAANPPAVDNGVVYMASGHQQSTYMLAFDAATGNVRMKSAMSSQWENYLPPIVQNGAVYTNAGTYGGMYAFALSGEQLFSKSLSSSSMWSPAGDARAIYAYTGDALTMYEPKTGAVLATIPDVKFTNYVYQVGGAAVIGANGVYAAAYTNGYLNGGGMGNNLTRFDTAKGFVDWRVPGVYQVTPAYSDGVLYAPNFNPYRVEARAEADGKLLWSWIPPLSSESAFQSSPVVTKNLLFVSSNRNTYAIDLKTHLPVWSYPAPGYLAISQNGTLYIQSPDALVAVNLK